MPDARAQNIIAMNPLIMRGMIAVVRFKCFSENLFYTFAF